MDKSKESVKTILVVDDEPEIRKLVGAMVQRHGYKVLTADNGDHAITLLKNQKTPVDLLLTDVVAPGMSGPMLADKLVEQQPGLRVLFMTGYPGTHIVQSYIVEKGFALLHKPFTAEQLGRKVAELLAKPKAAPAA